jgi:hypothetical protein
MRDGPEPESDSGAFSAANLLEAIPLEGARRSSPQWALMRRLVDRNKRCLTQIC